MKTSFDMRLPCSLFLVFERVAPALEKKRSDGTDVATIPIFCLAIVCKLAHTALTSHGSSGDVLRLFITGFAKKS